jgi:hypothetical protein
MEQQARPVDESSLASHTGLTELLRVPSLRSVYFGEFFFTPALCQAIANALMKGSAITNLGFQTLLLEFDITTS